MTYCVCDEKSPCLYHKEKGMSNHQNEVIAEDKKEAIEDLKCEGCGKLLAYWNEKEQCSCTVVPCDEGLYLDKITGKAYCDDCAEEGEVIEEDGMKRIHYDLEQTLREARRESGMTLRSIASVIVEVLDRDEIKALIEEINATSK